MDLQDPQSTKYDAQRARAKLMEAAYTVSVVHGNHMTCSAGHAGTLALKAELTAVGDSPLAAAEAAGDGSKGLAERAGGLVAAARAAIEAAREATLPEECTAAELRALGRLKAVSRTIIAGFPCGCPSRHRSGHRCNPNSLVDRGRILPRAPATTVRTGGAWCVRGRAWPRRGRWLRP